MIGADERSGAAHQVLAHQSFPVLGVLGAGERGQGGDLPVDLVRQGRVEGQCPGRGDAQVVVGVQVQAELVGDVEEPGVERGRGQQQDPRVVGGDVLAQCLVVAPVGVAQGVGLVNDHEGVAAQVGQDGVDHGVRHNAPVQAVRLQVRFPHTLQVLRTHDQGLVPVLIAEHEGHSHGDEGLAEADDVAEHRAAPGHHPAGDSAHGGGLEVQKLASDLGGDRVLGQAFAHIPGQVVADLGEHLEWAAGGGRGPGLLDKGKDVLGDGPRERVVPPVLEPGGEFTGGVEVDHVDVQLVVAGKPGDGEVGRPNESGDRVVQVGPVENVRLAVQGTAGEDLDGHGAVGESAAQGGQGGPVPCGGHAAHQLGAQVLDELSLAFACDGRVGVDRAGLVDASLKFVQGCAGGVGREHSDEDPDDWLVRYGLGCQDVLEHFPTAQVEVTDCDVHPVELSEGGLQVRAELVGDVVEDPGHEHIFVHHSDSPGDPRG